MILLLFVGAVGSRSPSLDLLHHLLFFVLDLHVLEVLPLGQYFHGLDVLDGGELVPVVLVSAERVQVDFFTESFVLPLDDLEDVGYLLALVDVFVVDADDRVEDGPHNFRVVHSA